MNHPGYVGIPDARTQGVRSYREPEQPHPLQVAFLTEEGERAYVARIYDLLTTNRLEEADAILTADLAGFSGSLASTCRYASADAVSIEGWEDLLPILDEFEGPPITGITIGLTNEADLVFEGNEPREPSVMLGLYSDEQFDFSGATREQLLNECASEMPGWAGHEEDVEFYVDCAGLGELNTALIQCKHRYFLRDGRDGVEGRAPGGYVEYVLGTWIRATRFLQAVERAAAEHGVPAGAKLIAGTIGLHTDLATVIEQGRAVDVERTAAAARPVAELTIKRWTPRPDPALEIAASGSALRQKIQSVASEAEPEVEAAPLAKPIPSPFAQPAPALVIPTIPPLPTPEPTPAPMPEPIAAPVAVSEPPPVPPPAFAATQPVAPAPEPEPFDTPEEKRGFFARLFGRRRGE